MTYEGVVSLSAFVLAPLVSYVVSSLVSYVFSLTCVVLASTHSYHSALQTWLGRPRERVRENKQKKKKHSKIEERKEVANNAGDTKRQ